MFVLYIYNTFLNSFCFYRLVGKSAQKSKVILALEKGEPGDFQYTCCSVCLGKWSANFFSLWLPLKSDFKIHLWAKVKMTTATERIQGEKSWGKKEEQGREIKVKRGW